jgi:predicted O-methyltransferase YrrM
MNDVENLRPPAVLAAIEKETSALGFRMASDPKTGSLLRTLAATKPAGEFLELGTGTGISTAWILEGMDQHSRLTSIDNDATVMAVARRHLSQDPRVTFHTVDGTAFLETLREQTCDFIFADTWPGKYEHLEKALGLLKPGGVYIIDDMLPQPSWPDGHAAKVPRLIAALEQSAGLVVTKLSWSTGLVIATKRAWR